jgi:hypothetical protein
MDSRFLERKRADLRYFSVSLRNKIKKNMKIRRARSPLPWQMPGKILIGTHHKTGTNWFINIFREICKCGKLAFFAGDQDTLPTENDVFLQDHSYFTLNDLGKPFKGIHIIRDPRDVIISGCFYHQKSYEPWLHCRSKRFSGMTYSEKINSYSSLEDKIVFEMENAGSSTINDMRKWNYFDKHFYELKYEDLIADQDLFLFHEIFVFLGFTGYSLPVCLEIAYKNSLFSGQLRKNSHIRSGKANQWQSFFTSRHKKRFVQLFDDTLVTFGYEKDNSWAE